MMIGHQKIWRLLEKSAGLGKLSHAYLFSGQEFLGKKTLAFEFIKLLYCQQTQKTSGFLKQPCQTCKSCQDVHKKQHPDLFFIEPIKKEIRISQIKEFNRRLSFRPYIAPLKSAIIDKAHLMNQEAQSAFLKTLEEPKGDALLILVTDRPEMLLPTILSRVQKIRFNQPNSLGIKQYFSRERVPKGLAQEILLFSDERPGLAINLLKNPNQLKHLKQKIAELAKLANSGLFFRFEYAKNLAQDSVDLKDTLEFWLRYLRKILIQRINRQKINYFSEYSTNSLQRIISSIQNTDFLISHTNVNPRLALEVLMLEL